MIRGRLDNCGLYVVQAQELLANITLLEVAVLKLEEQSSVLQSEVGQARTEREIAQLRLSSAESAHLEGSNLHFFSSGSNGTFRDDHIISLPGTEPESHGQHLKAVATPTSLETTAQQPCISLGCPTPEQESELGQQPQKSWKVCFDKPSCSSAARYLKWSHILCMSKNTFAVWSYRSFGITRTQN